MGRRSGATRAAARRAKATESADTDSNINEVQNDESNSQRRHELQAQWTAVDNKFAKLMAQMAQLEADTSLTEAHRAVLSKCYKELLPLSYEVCCSFMSALSPGTVKEEDLQRLLQGSMAACRD